jgi:ankyrin repeat protein
MQPPARRADWASLPLELLAAIFAFAPARALAAASSTCTVFYDAAGASLVLSAVARGGRGALWAALPRRRLLALHHVAGGGGGAAGAADAAVFAAARGAVPLLVALAAAEPAAVARARHAETGAGLIALLIEAVPGPAGAAAVAAALRLGACARAPAGNGLAPIHVAAAAGAVDALRVLLAAEADEAAAAAAAAAAARGGARAADAEPPPFASALVHARTPDGRTALFFAAARGHAGAVAALLRAGADADAATPLEAGAGGETALHAACARGHAGAALALLRGGADPNAALRNGRTPLLLAVEAEAEDAVRALLTAAPHAPTDTAAATDSGKTALYVAAERGATAIVELLLAAGADGAAATHRRKRALHAAAEKAHEGAVRALLAAAAARAPPRASPAWAASDAARTALQAAARAGSARVRDLCLDAAGPEAARFWGAAGAGDGVGGAAAAAVAAAAPPPPPPPPPLAAPPLRLPAPPPPPPPRARAPPASPIMMRDAGKQRALVDAARGRNAERLALALGAPLALAGTRIGARA